MKRGFIHPYLLFFFLWGFSLNVVSQEIRENQLIKAYEAESDSEKKFNRLMALGEYYKSFNIDKADSIKDVILTESHNFNDSLRFNALFYNAEIELIQGNKEDYFNKILACQPFLNKLNSEEIVFKVYRHLGFYHSSILEIETADFYLNQAIKIAKRQRNKVKLAESYSYLALNFMVANEKDSAIYFSDQSIKYGRRTSNKTVLAKAFNIQAKIYDFFGQIELSVAKNLVSLQLAEQTDNIYLQAQVSREVGAEQMLIKNWKDAERYFKRSHDHAEQIHDFRQMALALTSRASVQLEYKAFDLAISLANKSIDYLEEVNDLNGLGETHDLLGMIYREQGNYEKASSNFNQALVYFEINNNKEKIAGVYHNVGTVFQKQKRYANALNYLNRSIEIREEFGAKNQIYASYRVISEVYKEINDPKTSLKYLELYMNFVDSNTTIQAATKIAELSESYRSEQRERIINVQADSIKRSQQERLVATTQLEYSQLRNSFQMYVIIGFILIVLLAGTIIFYRWNQAKITQERKTAEMAQTLLRAQMNPHFVFNAMSVIQSYIYENDVENSTKFLVNFSRLMRLILENSPKEHISIETEIEILQKYLATQKLRFEDRFEFYIEADDILLDESAQLPPMITQPFIENSIEHGQLHTIEDGFIRVRFTKENDMLNIMIEDNGIGRKASKLNKKNSAHKSMAMGITRERIENLNRKYKSEGFMRLEDYNKQEATGTKVIISLPYTVKSHPLN